MSEQIMKHIKTTIYIAIVIFIICCLISPPTKLDDISSYIGYSISITFIIAGGYEKWGWLYNPFEKTPKLLKKYVGTIEYSYNGENGKKRTEVIINQSLFSIKVEIITDEIRSQCIASKIIKENGNYVLYYTYITNPKSKYSEYNPIQYGTCRILLDDIENLHGIYWTTSKTKGDIYLKGGGDNVN